MPDRGRYLFLAAALACALASAALAGDAPDAAKPNRPMPMNEPMPTKMAKPGMKTGDVKKAAEKADRRMRPVLDKDAKPTPGK